MGRTVLTHFDNAGLKLDHGSAESIKSAALNNNFTGCIDLETKTIYLGPMAPSPNPADNHYVTVVPTFQCFAAGAPIAPIIHTNGGHMTGHHQIAAHVLKAMSIADNDDGRARFGGFALRFEAGRIALSGTSGTLNPGENRQLEQPVLQALFAYLTAEIGKVRPERLEIEPPRTSPTAVAAAIGGAAVAANRSAMLGGLKGLFNKGGGAVP